MLIYACRVRRPEWYRSKCRRHVGRPCGKSHYWYDRENNIFNALSQKDAFGRMNYNGFTQGNFVYRDENNNLQPYFWTSFEISEDGKQIDFTMPLDAVWHDGEPVTMDDMVFTFEYMRDVKR